MQPYTIVLEKGDDGDLWGQLHADGALLTATGATRAEVTEGIRDLLADFIENCDLPGMVGVDPTALEFEYAWHVEVLFEHFDFLNVSAFARHADINPGLLRQYASGVKHPTEATARRIEGALRELGASLQKAVVVA